MGNRAYVIFANATFKQLGPAIYLHWNGGAESIYPFLDELDRREVRVQADYESARFIAIAAEYFDQAYYGTLSLGVENGPRRLADVWKFDPGDNGVYVVARDGKGGRVVRRFFQDRAEKKARELTLAEVEAECIAAYAHKYSTGERPIAAAFTKITERAYSEAREKQISRGSNGAHIAAAT